MLPSKNIAEKSTHTVI